jgi:hypothetical protein
MAELNLLHRKEFEITLNDKSVIKGQYSLWSIKRYCDKKNFSLTQLNEQLTSDKISFDDVCQLLLCAVEYKTRVEKKGFSFTDIDACEWIEQLGGLMGEKYTALMNHAKSEDDSPVNENEEKKSP